MFVISQIQPSQALNPKQQLAVMFPCGATLSVAARPHDRAGSLPGNRQLPPLRLHPQRTYQPLRN